jgi:hypothetical protein
MANRIGSEYFKVLRGDPTPKQEHIDPIVRDGVDLAAFRLLGLRGPQFTLESMVDLANEAAAASKLGAYATMKASGKLALEVDGINYGSASCVVLHVVPIPPIKTVACIKGGINVADGLPGVILRAQWTLQLV